MPRCTIVGLLAAASIFFAFVAQGIHIGDFDGDGRDDVLLRTDGTWHIYSLNGLLIVGGDTEATGLPHEEFAWRIVGTGDLNGDGNADVLTRHTDGTWRFYAMRGTQHLKEIDITSALPEDLLWSFAGIGDFNGDGIDEVLLRHSTGRWAYFTREDEEPFGLEHELDLPQDLRARFASVANLNGDATDDVLLHHENGQWFYHPLQQGMAVDPHGILLDLSGDASLALSGIGDLNGDGKEDVLLRGTAGHWHYFAMDGSRVLETISGRAEIASGETWRLGGIGDLDGDGSDDLLLRNIDGKWYYYAMDGRQSVSARSGEPELPAIGSAHECKSMGGASYVGYVDGFSGENGDIEVVLSGQSTFLTTKPETDGCFTFSDVARGRYAIKINAAGHRATPARIVRFPFREVYDGLPYSLEIVPTNPFIYHWQEDQTTPAGAEYSTHVVTPRKVEFQGRTLDVVDSTAADRLILDYNVILVGDEWSQEHAFRLLQTLEQIPQPKQRASRGELVTVPPSVWRLSADHIDGDIEFEQSEDGSREVTISADAFANAAPRVASVDGKQGTWFSRRLHHAAVRVVTDEGRHLPSVNQIFGKRYGLTTEISSYEALTLPTGGESKSHFQDFQPNELILMLNMMEEMPQGIHKVPGFKYLVRRLDGLDHPLYPTAPAVAWPSSEYVEFMEIAFKDQSEEYMHRLILHEKAHFLWGHLFDDQLKADWIELGGWYEDPSTTSGWSTTKSAEFVSSYAHLKNPNEDMAESISFFVVNPDRLRARAPAKYEFVRDRIMQGSIYIAQIREDLTFEVYNLFPDYVHPGKVRSVDIKVEGGPEEDKKLTVDIGLHALDAEKEGAKYGVARVVSPIGTSRDLLFYPIDVDGRRNIGGTSTSLRAEVEFSKYAKAGYWLPKSLELRDEADNSRFQRVSDFGWRMYVDNPNEDYTAPQYVPRSVNIQKSTYPEDETVQVVHLDWSINEEGSGLRAGQCRAAIDDVRPNTYTIVNYGEPYEQDDGCKVEYLMPNYMPTTTYSVRHIVMQDLALNVGRTEFTDDPESEPAATFELITSNPDYHAPELDENRITISAEPTNPAAPNGETNVDIRYYFKDNISGLAVSNLLLRDPQGSHHKHYIYPDDRNDLYPAYDPTIWQQRDIRIILPEGSLPGIWGLAEMDLRDRAGNSEIYNFVEIVHFQVDGG